VPATRALAPSAGQSPATVADGYPTVFTVDQAAIYLQSNVPKVVSEIEAGRILGCRLAGHRRLREQAIDDWLDGAYRTITKPSRAHD
jgi:excisionase family DNA binding protein